MATVTYKPDGVDSVGYRGTNNANPGTDISVWRDTTDSSAEETTISTDDSNYVRITGPNGSPPTLYPGHTILLTYPGVKAAVTQIDVVVKVKASTVMWDVYLWNFTTSAWDLVGSNVDIGKQTVSATVAVTPTNYIHTSSKAFDILITATLTSDLDLFYTEYTFTYTPWSPTNAMNHYRKMRA